MIETINNAVILPHLPNWTEKVKHSRTWATEIASGIAGGEDRAGARTLPLRSITYRVETLLGNGPQENEVLAERVKAALKSGRAVCPLFGRAQPVSPDGLWSLQAGGLWFWTAGEFAFLTLPEHTGINQEIMIDCGGPGGGTQSAHQPEDNFTHTGGRILTTDHAIAANSDGDTLVAIGGVFKEPADVDYVTPPPVSVLQSCRYDDTPGPDRVPITYTLRVANIWRCKVRLWFCPFALFAHDSTYQITVTGGTVPMTGPRSTQVTFNPTLSVAGVPYCPTFLDVSVYPSEDGTIQVTIASGHSDSMILTAIEVYSTCWQLLPIREVQALDLPTLVFGAARIKFGDLADVPAIYPVLFGQLTIGDTKAITNWHGSVDLTVSEPMGDAVQGLLGGFNEELCGLPDVTPEPPVVDPVFYTLSVGSLNPASGVPIGVMPLDYVSAGPGLTAFTRRYAALDVSEVTLTAPAVAAGNNFVRWTKAVTGGAAADLTASVFAAVVTMDDNYTLIAKYVTPPPPDPVVTLVYPVDLCGSTWWSTSLDQGESLRGLGETLAVQAFPGFVTESNDSMELAGGITETYMLTGKYGWIHDTTTSQNPNQNLPALANYPDLHLVNRDGDMWNLGAEYTIITDTQPIIPPALITGGFRAAWSRTLIATGYQLDVSTDPLFATYLDGYQGFNIDLGTTLSQDITGLTAGVTYYFRVRAIVGLGVRGNSARASVMIPVIP